MAEIFHFENSKIFQTRWMPEKIFLKILKFLARTLLCKGLQEREGISLLFLIPGKKNPKTVNHLDSRQLWYTFSFTARAFGILDLVNL